MKIILWLALFGSVALITFTIRAIRREKRSYVVRERENTLGI